MVDIERAITLRKRGLSFEEVAQEMGCSLSWCKKRLRGVKKEKASILDESGYRKGVEDLLEEFLSRVRML